MSEDISVEEKAELEALGRVLNEQPILNDLLSNNRLVVLPEGIDESNLDGNIMNVRGCKRWGTIPQTGQRICIEWEEL